MERSTSSSLKKVHYAENENTQNEHIIPEAEKYSAISEISKSSMKYSGDVNSEISIATSILDVDEIDPKELRKKLEDYEYKIKYLENENNQINEHLIAEKKRNSKLEKKLQFVKDNQEVFMRLKEAYINMKYNEAAGRKMIEIRERGIQTWEGTVCSSCIESEELRRQIDILMQKYAELFIVSPGEMEHLLNTVKYLKDLIDRREESWAINIEREHKLQSQIAILEDENLKLREVVTNSEKNEVIPANIIEDVKMEQKLLEERKIEEMQKFVEGLTKDLDKLKKIILKYEKKFREIKEQNYGKYIISPLNDKETKIVHQIIAKCNAKMQKKVLEESARSRSPSVDTARTAPNRRPSSPIRNSPNTNKSPERPKSRKSREQRNDSAILMMDCLFD